MKKFIAILISSSMILAPVAFADQTSGTNSTDQVMREMPGNDANTMGNQASADQQKPMKKHHMKKHHAKKHKRHHRHHKSKPATMAPTQ